MFKNKFFKALKTTIIFLIWLSILLIPSFFLILGLSYILSTFLPLSLYQISIVLSITSVALVLYMSSFKTEGEFTDEYIIDSSGNKHALKKIVGLLDTAQELDRSIGNLIKREFKNRSNIGDL